MKKTTVLFFILALILTSCETSNPLTDDRDQFDADYSVTSTGSLTAVGLETTIPINGTGYFSIRKKSSSGSVAVTGYFNSEGIVSGNSIKLDSETATITENGLTMILTFNHMTGNLNGNVLTFKSNITGTISQNGMTIPIVGTQQNIAIKQ